MAKRPLLEKTDLEKCRGLADSALVLLLNQSSNSKAEITNLTYHEAIAIEDIIDEEIPQQNPNYILSYERIPVIDGDSLAKSYKLIIGID